MCILCIERLRATSKLLQYGKIGKSQYNYNYVYCRVLEKIVWQKYRVFNEALHL